MKKLLFSCAAAILFIFLSLVIYQNTPHAKEAHCNPDSFGYERIALNFAHGGSLKDPTTDEMPPQPLGYPFLLAGIFKFFGNDYRPVILLQLQLALATIFLVGVAASHLFGNAAFYPAVLLGVINTGFLVYPHFILTETVLTFLLAFFLERFSCFVSFRSYPALLAASFLIGCSLAIKAIALFFIPVFFLFTAFYLWQFRMKSLHMIFIIVAVLPVPLMVMSYNYHLYGSWQIAPTMHENIYVYFLTRVKMREQGITFADGRAQIEQTFGSLPRSDSRRWLAAQEQLHSYFHQKPLLLLTVWGLNCIKTYSGLFATQLKNLLNLSCKDKELTFFNTHGFFWDRMKGYIAMGALSTWVILAGWSELILMMLKYMLLMVAVVYLLKRNRALILFFLSYIAYFALVTGHEGCARYRMPIEPLIIILASYGILWFMQWLQSRSNRSKNSQKWVPA
jgi:hypothetical protein